MNLFLVIGLITLIITFLSCLFSFFLITVKRKKRIGNILLAFYLLISTLELSTFLYSNFIEISTIVDKLRDDLSYLRIPLFYFYILSAIYSDFKISIKKVYHLIPFLLILIVFIPRFYGVDKQQRMLFNQAYYSNPEVIFSIFLIHLQELCYIILAFIQLKKYNRLLLENHSEIISFNYKWLYQLIVLWSIIFIIAFIKSILTLTNENIVIVEIVQLLLILCILLFICSIVLKALYQPSIFKNINSRYQLSKSSYSHTLKTSTFDVSPDKRIAFQLAELKKFMVDKELYLDPNLSISDLALHMQLSSNEVSTLINRHLKKHFFDFVNIYRLEKAKEILRDQTAKQLTILEILYSVGFNSKSSFNSAFKKHAQLTPTQYRKKHG